MFKFSEEEGRLTITSFAGQCPPVLVIPSQIDGKPVWGVGNSAFMGKNEVEKIILGDGIRELKSYCFSKMENLKEVVFPETLETIQEGVFLGCSKLEEVNLGGNLTLIGDKAFSWCSSLKHVVFSPDYADAASSLGKEEGVNESFKQADERFIPPSLIIEKNAFSFCTQLCQIEFKEGLKEIRKGAFSICSKLREIVTPKSLEVIGSQCFEGCSNLTDVILKDGLKTIESWAFRECKSLRVVELPKSLEVLGEGAFIGCLEIRSVRIPKGVREIKDWSFGKCRNIEFMEIPEGIESIGCFAFSRCRRVKRFYMPVSLKAVKRGAFSVCLGVERIDFGYGVETIEDNAFEMCSNLKWIRLPQTVQKLNLIPFYECKNLLGIEYVVKDAKVDYVYIPPIPKGMKFIKKMEVGKINWQDYDMMFKKINGQKYKLEMAIYRLKNPVKLKTEFSHIYLMYLKKYAKQIIIKAIWDDDIELTSFMGDKGLISEKYIDEYISLATIKKGRTTGFFIDYKQKRFGEGKKISSRFTL